MVTVTAAYIGVDDAGGAWIEGTTTKVIEVALTKITSGLSPEEVQEELPHLSVPQVYAALAYYYAHQEELDVEIQRRREWTNEMRGQEVNPLQREDLRSRLPQGK